MFFRWYIFRSFFIWHSWNPTFLDYHSSNYFLLSIKSNNTNLISNSDLTSIAFLFFSSTNATYLTSDYLDHIKKGLQTLILKNNSDSSVSERLEIWSAAIKAANKVPLFGYGVTERFHALTPFLNGSVPFYTHPHNDILASIISIGF